VGGGTPNLDFWVFRTSTTPTVAILAYWPLIVPVVDESQPPVW